MNKSTSALISFPFILLLLCLLLNSASAKKIFKCHPQDQTAIEQIAASFGINFTGDCCDWKSAVGCDHFPPYSRVTLFAPTGSDISGHISDAIGDLFYLEYLYIMNASRLIGTIPPTISKLSKLKSLIIYDTNISGPIPTFQENLVGMFNFDLRNNALTGSIPSELPIWFPNLEGIQLDNNKLTGNIPESFGNWAALNSRYLTLANNSLTGPIPKSLVHSDPYYVDLSGNNFYGDASPLFGENKTGSFLLLNGNNFSFDLSNVQFSRNLTTISLSYNNIFGSLPQELTQLPLLIKLDVSHNMLCGEIPQGGQLQQFNSSSYSYNKCLCGAPLPPCVK